VSLVGQWIEEAKSKLLDPGLVYPYHGQSRKRDASILAKNAIVVTTYQVLVSDANYHAKKAGDDYCAPLEQVRWWRIICDEGHSLRDGQTSRAKAAGILVADHKWIVTGKSRGGDVSSALNISTNALFPAGTPVNTSFKDLKNQLKFLGIENVDAMFNMFLKQGRNRVEEFDAGKLLFFLRNIMIRHTQKQTYRGTTTTLMSLPAKVSQSGIALVVAIKYIVDLIPFLSIPFFFRRKGMSKSLSRIRSRLSMPNLSKVRKLFIRRLRHIIGASSVAISSRFLRSLLQCESPAPAESTPSMGSTTRTKLIWKLIWKQGTERNERRHLLFILISRLRASSKRCSWSSKKSVTKIPPVSPRVPPIAFRLPSCAKFALTNSFFSFYSMPQPRVWYFRNILRL
jgi:hypothetical protein